MGSVFARVALGIERPRVGLLSIGEEETKGNDLIREAHRLLKASPLHFVGNVDARAVYGGTADVIVCDGFTGNVALKVSEGLAELIVGADGGGARPARHAPDRLAPGSARPSAGCGSGSTTPSTAARRCSGWPDSCMVGHGRSSARAVRNAVALAHRFAESGLVGSHPGRDRRSGSEPAVIAFVFPGQGSQTVGMGQGARRGVSGLRARRSPRPTRRSASR